MVGYFIVAYVLLPIYYKNQVTSIYEYLKAADAQGKGGGVEEVAFRPLA